MNRAVFAFTRQGCKLARKIGEVLPKDGETRLYTMEKFGEPGFLPIQPPLAEFTGDIFAWAEAMIFVGACGVAVRAIAPWVKDKKKDPAVLVLDEKGQFVISLLSGHIGNANALARQLAGELGATAVITTATDVEGRFSVDEWAARRGLTILSMKAAKAVSAAILEGDVPMCLDVPTRGALPPGVVLGDRGELGIYVGYRNREPFTQTLCLIPKILHLGIGCRRGISREAVEEAVSRVLREQGIRREAIKLASSIDLKAAEPGLLAFCESWGLPTQFYPAEELKAVAGDFTPSPFVESVTGVDNVCERAAMVGAEKIIVSKTALNGVTVALAEEYWEVSF